MSDANDGSYDIIWQGNRKIQRVVATLFSN